MACTAVPTARRPNKHEVMNVFYNGSAAAVADGTTAATHGSGLLTWETVGPFGFYFFRLRSALGSQALSARVSGLAMPTAAA